MSDVLQRLTDTAAGWDATRADDRAACQQALGAMARNMEAAIAVWRECAGDGGPVDNRFTALIRLGSERARALHRLHLEQKAAAAEASRASGVALGDTMGLEPDLDIVLAYGNFRDDETVAARAEQAIATLEARRAALEEAVARL